MRDPEAASFDLQIVVLDPIIDQDVARRDALAFVSRDRQHRTSTWCPRCRAIQARLLFAACSTSLRARMIWRCLSIRPHKTCISAIGGILR